MKKPVWKIDADSGLCIGPHGETMFADFSITASGGIRCAGPYLPYNCKPKESIDLSTSFIEEVEDRWRGSYLVWGTLEEANTANVGVLLADQSIPWLPLLSVRSHTLLSSDFPRRIYSEWSRDTESKSLAHRSGFEVVQAGAALVIVPGPGFDSEIHGAENAFRSLPHWQHSSSLISGSVYSFLFETDEVRLSADNLHIAGLDL